MTKDSVAVLNGLIETLKDGELGFEAAASDVSQPELRQVLTDFAAQRGQFARALQYQVELTGEHPEVSGSLGGTVHRGWINLKAAVAMREDLAVLEECERGEDAALKVFTDAVAGGELGASRTIVEGQTIQIRAAHDQVRALRDGLRAAV
jgi:uncharacterized protein (TIGR02284 family)